MGLADATRWVENVSGLWLILKGNKEIRNCRKITEWCALDGDRESKGDRNRKMEAMENGKWIMGAFPALRKWPPRDLCFMVVNDDDGSSECW
jgi:hypothetical protein